jgi:hypothetical protein
MLGLSKQPRDAGSRLTLGRWASIETRNCPGTGDEHVSQSSNTAEDTRCDDTAVYGWAPLPPIFELNGIQQA